MQADEHTYTTLIKTLSYAGRVDDALKVCRLLTPQTLPHPWGPTPVSCMYTAYVVHMPVLCKYMYTTCVVNIPVPSAANEVSP